MNKLVSRNPVLRFKLGKKIVKAEEGAVARWQRRIKSGINGIGSAFKGAFDMTFNPNNTLFGSLKIYDFARTIPSRIINGLVVENYTPENGGTTNNRLKNQQLNNNLNIAKQQNTYKTPELKGSKEAYLNRLKLLGFTAKSTKPVVKSDPVVKKQSVIPRSGWSYGFDRSKEGIGDIAAMQRKLKAEGYYADNENSRDDGKWGQSTENAYKRYLAKQKAMELPPEVKIPDVVTPTNPVVTPTVTPTVTPLKTALLTSNTRGSNDASLALKRVLGKNNNFLGLTNFVWNENNVYPDEYSRGIAMDLRNMFSKFGDKLSWLDNQEDIERALNISGTYRGTRAGDYGDLARALATYNGIKDGEVYRFNTGLKYKTGGQLVSRNPVKRFKNKKK